MRSLIFCIAFLLPFSAFALETTVWDFQNGQMSAIPQLEETLWLSVENTGLRLRAPDDTSIMWENIVPHPIDAIGVEYQTSQTIRAYLQWHRRGEPDGSAVRMPIVFQASPAGFSRLDINTSLFPYWDAKVDRIFFVLPKGADLYIQSLHFSYWNLIEKLSSAWKSFWTMDSYRPSNLNFLWGPLFAYTPVALDQLVAAETPQAHSANRLFYILLMAAALPALIAWRRRGAASDSFRGAMWWFLLCFAGLWIVYDVRMGAELISYLRDDAQEYWRQDTPKRTFRDRGNFYDLVAALPPLVNEGESYTLLTDHEWPFFGLIRYYTYPVLPVHPQDTDTGTHMWVVFYRSSARVDEGGKLMDGTTALAASGSVIFRLSDNAYVYRSS